MPRQPRTRIGAPAGWTTNDWATPPEVVERYAHEFGPFDLDPCATAATAKAPTFYTEEMDGRKQGWFGNVWLNPPYSAPAAWVQKAVDAVRSRQAVRVVALLPASTDTAWFHRWVLPYAEIRFLKGRIKFLGWDGQSVGTPKSGSIIAIYRSLQ